MVVKSQTAAG